MPLPIPDAVAADLRDLLLSALPTGVTLPADSVRLKIDTEEIPSPRLVILAGDPRGVTGMDGTARLPISLDYITSLDRVTPDAHRAASSALDAWLRGLKAAKRRDVISTRCYLHDIYIKHPVATIREDDREQVTTIRGEVIVTLVDA